MLTPICPQCAREARPTSTRFGVRHDCCSMWSWDGAPLVDAATHEARKRAHEAFDPLWTSGLISRKAAYKILALKLTIDPKLCHIKLMPAWIAEKIPDAVEKIKKEAGIKCQ